MSEGKRKKREREEETQVPDPVVKGENIEHDVLASWSVHSVAPAARNNLIYDRVHRRHTQHELFPQL